MSIVREEIKQCLARPNDGDHCRMAYGIYSAQFDHPYTGAYCEVVSGLSDHEQRTLLEMAAKGADDSAFFLSSLLTELASFGNPESGESVVRWTALPPRSCSMPQDAIAVFIVAHIVLARLGCPLPDKQIKPGNSAFEALAACGTILYWCNRADLDESERRNACQSPLRLLSQHGLDAGLDVIRQCEHSFTKNLDNLSGNAPVERSIAGCFPTEVVEISRHSLLQPDRQIGYFRHFSRSDSYQNLSFAIDVLAHLGNCADFRLLRRYAADPDLGTSAIAAVRMIEERLASA